LHLHRPNPLLPSSSPCGRELSWSGRLDRTSTTSGRSKTYNAILRDYHDNEFATPDDLIAACLECYRANFVPEHYVTDLVKLENVHTALMEQWRTLPTKRTQEKAKERFIELEARIEELQQQQENAADIVAGHCDSPELADSRGATNYRASVSMCCSSN